MSVRELESELNRRLREIHKGCAVKNLERLPSGEYWFDLAMGFNARDMANMNQRLRKHAAERGIKQSALVEEAIETALAGTP